MLSICLLLLAGTASGQGLTWHAPESGYAGQPVMVAYAIHDGDGLTGHVNVDLTITLDGEPLVETPFIHEHDGFASFVVAPSRPGTLAFVAKTSDKVTTVTVPVLASGDAAARAQDSTLRTDEGSVTLETGFEDPPVWALLEGHESGRLIWASWQSSAPTLRIERQAGWSSQALVTTAPDSSLGAGAVFLDGPAVGGTPSAIVSAPALDALLGEAPSCLQEGFVFDPNWVDVDGEPTWQQAATVRLSRPDHDGTPMVYTLLEALGDADRLRVVGTAEDPFAQAAFTPDGPGEYGLLAQWTDAGEQMECQSRFRITANTAPSGSVDAQITVDGDQAELRFEPLDAAGNNIGHYEFDTRVVHDAPTAEGKGRLVFVGKLHEHGGAASLTLSGLAPGDYTVWTHPSPQNQDGAPVAPDGPDGFRYSFTVPARPETDPDEGTQDTPVGLLWPLTAVAVALALRRRH